MAKKRAKQVKPTIITASGEVTQIDSRKLQALYIYNQLHCTQLELANFFGVSENTIKNWLKDAKSVVNDGNMMEMAKSRFHSLVPAALEVYDKALDLGKKMPRAEYIGAAKDVLKERGIITEKQTLEVELVSKDDKDIEAEIARIVNDRFKPVQPGGTSQN